MEENEKPTGLDPKALAAEISKSVSAALAEVLKGAIPQPPAKPAKEKAKPVEEELEEEVPGEKKPKDPRVRAMERELEKMKTELDAQKTAREAADKKAEEKERHAAIRSKLADYPFASDQAREAAFKLLRDDIRRGAEDVLVGGADELPFTEYIEKQLEANSYLLAPKDVGGAGAHNTGARNWKPVDLDSIKPGMSQEDLQRVRDEIARVARQQFK